MSTPFDCPRCGVTLAMTDRQGVEVDYCPTCRGVWLDRGELDKLIERAAEVPPAAQQSSAWTAPGGAPGGYPPASPQYDDRGYGGGHGRGHGGGHGSGYGRRRSWLRDMFD